MLSEGNTMISPKLAVLMAAMTLVGIGTVVGSPLAYAVTSNGGDSVAVDVERNNELEQENEQSQEACTNELEAELSDNDLIDIGGDNEVEADQENDCLVFQDQDAENNGAILDFSTNDFDLETILATVGLSL